ncbi:MAG: FAD-binding protein, partial [Mycobacteriales bacterium]
DAKARARYQFTGILPGADFPGSFYKSGLVTKADTLSELCVELGMPSGSLQRTVARFNELVRKGHDDDFGRGDSAYDRYYGDPNLPNPSMDEIGEGPYYAVRIVAGDLGTKGGLVTDEHGQVLGTDGQPIDGLYATGNVSASVMGNDYAGAGATIGPAMVFGYLAVEHLASRERVPA